MGQVNKDIMTMHFLLKALSFYTDKATVCFLLLLIKFDLSHNWNYYSAKHRRNISVGILLNLSERGTEVERSDS